MGNYQFIAEVKTQSPHDRFWQSERTWDQLLNWANLLGDMVSIHIEEPWGGSIDLIERARPLVRKPILAKGINEDDEQIRKAFAAGADLALKVGELPASDLLDRCLMEPRSPEDLEHYPDDTKVVWNSRDLDTGNAKAVTFQEVRAIWPGWLCQASNIQHPNQVEQGADAILVGKSMPEFTTALLSGKMVQ